MTTRDLGVTPLTWTFAKLLGRQLRDNVRDWDGLPNSHAWAASGAARPQRLLTKAQCVGVLLSIHQRAERVELLVDDGTALVRAVLWTPTWDERLSLGDLVRVEGKLNMDSSWGNDTQSTNIYTARELRVVRIRKVSDPNEEMLHWLDVAELTAKVYDGEAASRAATSSHTSGTAAPEPVPSRQIQSAASSSWDVVVARAFHELTTDDAEVTAFLRRVDKSPHDQVLIETLRDLLTQQREMLAVATDSATLATQQSASNAALRFTFPDLLRDLLTKKSVTTVNELHHATTRSLRHGFARLRSSGLIFLEDTDSDRYLFLSAELVLMPALIEFLQMKANGASVPEIAEWVLTQERFKRIAIASVERALLGLLQAGQLDQHEEGSQQLFTINRSVSLSTNG